MDRGGGCYIVGREERHAPLEAIRVRDGCPWWMVEWVRATDCELRRMSMNRFGLLTANHPPSRMTDGGGADNVRISNIVRPQPLFTPPSRRGPLGNNLEQWHTGLGPLWARAHSRGHSVLRAPLRIEAIKKQQTIKHVQRVELQLQVTLINPPPEVHLVLTSQGQGEKLKNERAVPMIR